MNLSEHQTFSKEERIYGTTLTSHLFEGGNSKSMVIFPIRMIYMKSDENDNDKKSRILISVPKRLLHHAVDRNRVKRQIREAYRRNKHIINNKMSENNPDSSVLIAFIWTDKKLHSSNEINEKIIKLLKRLEEKL